MHRRTHRLITAGAAWAVAAVILAGTDYSSRSLAESPQAPRRPPGSMNRHLPIGTSGRTRMASVIRTIAS